MRKYLLAFVALFCTLGIGSSFAVQSAVRGRAQSMLSELDAGTPLDKYCNNKGGYIKCTGGYIEYGCVDKSKPTYSELEEKQFKKSVEEYCKTEIDKSKKGQALGSATKAIVEQENLEDASLDRRKECETKGGVYIPTGTKFLTDDQCNCPNTHVRQIVQVGSHNSVKSCGKCSEGYEPDPDKNFDQCRKKAEKTLEKLEPGTIKNMLASLPAKSMDDVPGEEPKVATTVAAEPKEPAETYDEKAFRAEFEKITERFDKKIKALTGK